MRPLRLHAMTDESTVLRVALPVPLARLFDYRAPEGLAVEAVPNGTRTRAPIATGVVAPVGAR